jgi:outer membrane lipopolysaccharide assembly protein LptE/RlpB
MKRILVRLLLLLSYLVIFLAAAGFDLRSLLDLRGILGVPLGSAILAAGSWYRGMKPARLAGTRSP